MKTEIDNVIDEIPMHEMTGEEAVKLLNPNSLKARIYRKNTRYKLYCLKSREEKGKIIPSNITEEFVKHYEDQHGFDGWKNFAVNWDVALHDPDTIVARMFSDEEEWHRIVMAKFPQIQPDGSVKYPDLRVKEAIDAEVEERRIAEEAKDNEEG